MTMKIIAAKAELGRDGIGSEPASATTSRASQPVASGAIDPQARIVAFPQPATPLKDTDAICDQ